MAIGPLLVALMANNNPTISETRHGLAQLDPGGATFVPVTLRLGTTQRTELKAESVAEKLPEGVWLDSDSEPPVVRRSKAHLRLVLRAQPNSRPVQGLGWIRVRLLHHGQEVQNQRVQIPIIITRQTTKTTDALEHLKNRLDGLGPENRLERSVLQDRIRATALGSSPAAKSALAHVLGFRTERRESLTRHVSAQTRDSAVAMAEAALRRLRLDTAEQRATEVLVSSPTTDELARVLRVRGAVRALRNHPDAVQDLGQALTLQPGLESPSPLPAVDRAFQHAQSRLGADPKVDIRQITAQRRNSDDQTEIVVHIKTGTDPFHLATIAKGELWGPGGGLIATRQADITGGENGRSAAILFPGRDATTLGDEHILIRARLLTSAGTIVTTVGDPRPKLVEMTSTSNAFQIPWWAWLIAGTAAAAGATSAIVLSQGEDTNRIGPVHANF